MNADLHTQLAEYGRYQRSERRPVELTDIQAAANAAGVPGNPGAQSPDHPTEFEPYEGDVIMTDIQTRDSGTTQTDEMNRRRWARWAILAAAAVIVVIVAVALFDGTEESTEIDVVDAPSDVVAPEPTEQQFPTGRFVGEIRAFEFNDDGTFGFFVERTSVIPGVEGTYSVDGDLYTEATSDYTPCPFPGTYAWTYDGENLAFQLVGEDECGVRVAAYDGKTFVKS